MSWFDFDNSKESTSLIDGCYTLSEVPGYKISKSIGLIQYTRKGIAGDIPGISEDIFKRLLSAAKEKGANAVVNVRIVSGSYEQQGSKWAVTYVLAYGDAVLIESNR